jgi:cytochrome d ubiquinol oxidase subunit II
MTSLWFCLVAIMLAVYVVLDGFDIGAGIVHLLIARTDAERRNVLRTIGPVWDGNEVWLLAAGGTLYFAFPALYASSFSGFYLPLIIVLWLLVLRGISIEFRSHLDSTLWRPFWDVVFAGSSLLLALFFGAALGNVVRGVPLDGTGYFFLPLWSDFRVSSYGGILDWYTVTAGVTALLALAMHGSLWIALKTGDPVGERARAIARQTWWGVAMLTVALTAASFAIQPHLAERFGAAPWGLVFPAISVTGLLGIRWARAADAELRAFLFSCAYLLGMLTSAAFGMYPYLLPASTDERLSLTIHNAAADRYGLGVGLAWWIPGMILASGYGLYTYKSFAGKVGVDERSY